jgi:hypothetical protein
VYSRFAALFLYPLRGQGGVLLVIEAFGLYLISALLDWSSGNNALHLLALVMSGVPLMFALGIFHLYAWATLRHIAAGHTETLHSVDIDEVSPLSNYLSIKVVLLLLGIAGAVSWSYTVSTQLGIYAGLGIGAVLPAALGVMILEEQFLPGVNPDNVRRFITDFGAAYSLFAGALYAGTVALYALFFAGWTPSIVATFAASFVFVLGHVLAGRVAYNYRHRLGLATLPDIDPAAAATDTAIESLMVELHRLCGVDHVDRAGAALEAFLRESDYALDERMHQRLKLFQDKRLLLEHNWHYLDRLVDARKLPRAWLLLRGSLAIDPLFRPGSAETVLALVEAAPSTDADLVDLLLSDFERAYPSNERVPEALFVHARLLTTALGRTESALALATRIERDFPAWSEDPEFRSFVARLRRHIEAAP